jgi:hypothetical protein
VPELSQDRRVDPELHPGRLDERRARRVTSVLSHCVLVGRIAEQIPEQEERHYYDERGDQHRVH